MAISTSQWSRTSPLFLYWLRRLILTEVITKPFLFALEFNDIYTQSMTFYTAVTSCEGQGSCFSATVCHIWMKCWIMTDHLGPSFNSKICSGEEIHSEKRRSAAGGTFLVHHFLMTCKARVAMFAMWILKIKGALLWRTFTCSGRAN